MAKENETIIASEAPSATYSADEFSLDGVDKQAVGNLLERAGNMQYVEEELREIDLDEPGLVASLFPDKIGDEEMPHPAIQLRARRQKAAKAIEMFMLNPPRGAWMVSDIFSIPLTSFGGLKASLIGPPINWNPVYQPIYALGLMRAATRAWKPLMEGSESLEYEDPINVGIAVTHNINGNPIVEYITGGKTKIYPMWLRTMAYTVDVMEWAVRLTKTVVTKQRQFRQELDKGMDDQFLTLFDAAVPDGSTIKDPVDDTIFHPEHIVTDTSGALTFANFKKAGRYLLHTASTGTAHNAPVGTAVVDPAAVFNLEDEGTDEWTESTTEWFNTNDFGIDYTRSNIVPKITPKGYTLARNPRATSTLNARFLPPKEYAGYFVPVSFQGRRTWVRTEAMVGQDPAFGQIRQTSMPPGFQFRIAAWECFAMAIAGILHIAKNAQT